MAQIAAEVRRGQVKNPDKVKVEDLLLHFKPAAEKSPEKSRAQRLKASKAFWSGVAGIPVPKDPKE